MCTRIYPQIYFRQLQQTTTIMNTPSASSGVSTPKIKYRVVRSKGREILPLEIYHNVSLRAPLRRPESVSDGKPVKQATNPPENPPETRRLCFYGMHEYARKCIARKFTPFSRGKSCFRRSSYPKTVNGDAIYCVAVKRCRCSRKVGIPHNSSGLA